jgi:hypothetical protein
MKQLKLSFTTIITLVIITFSVFISQNSIAQTSGLVAYYPFNNNANDESGNGNNGTVSGATLTTDRFGNANSAYSFDGASSKIDVAQSNNLFNLGQDQYTICGWFNSSNISKIAQEVFNTTPAAGLGFSFNYSVDASNRFSYFIGSGPSWVATNLLGNKTDYNQGHWYFFTLVKSGINYRFLIDRISDYEINVPEASSFNVSAGCTIGSYGQGYGEYFQGMLDDFRIYNRALSANEIDSLYHLGDWGYGPVAYYPFNGNANDESGNGNHGTVNGATLSSDRFGTPNRAYNFDGTSNYISVADTDLLDFSGSRSFSLSCWIKAATLPPQGVRNIIGKEKSDFSDYEWLLTISPDSMIQFFVGGFNGTSTPNNVQIMRQRWYHIVCVWNGNIGIQNLYRDGVLAASNTNSVSNLQHTNYTIKVGYVGQIPQHDFGGFVDDIRVYNRALSANEIDSLYHLNSWGNVTDTVKYRTFKESVADFTAKTVKLAYKKRKLAVPPNIMTAVENVFAKQVPKASYPKGRTFLGVSQGTNKDSIKAYAWIDLKKAGDLASGLKREHTGQSYPLDYLRDAVKGTKKKLSKAVKFTASMNNPAIAQGVLLKLNILASDSGVTPKRFGSLVIDTVIQLAGRNLKGLSLYEFANYYDSCMTYWKRFGIDTLEDYQELGNIATYTIKRINDGFYAAIDTAKATRNYVVDSALVVKKKPYSVTLSGTATAATVGIVKQPTDLKENASLLSYANTTYVPSQFALQQNYPNPFNPTTNLRFQISDFGLVTLKVYNVLGQEVATLIHSREMDEGMHEVQFDASGLTSGVYFYRLNVEQNGILSYTATKKLLLMK